MKPAIFSAFLLLLTVGNAQMILQTDFNDGWPVGWTSRFGFVDSGVLSFHNRSTTTDVFTVPMDLSGDGTFVLTFDLKTNAIDDNSLLIGLAPIGEGVTWIAGSASSALSKPLVSVLTGSPSWTTQTIDLTPTLSAFSPSERYGVRIAISTWLNSAVSSDAVYLDNFQVIDPPTSAIPEPACEACAIGLLAAVIALWKNRKPILNPTSK